MTVVDFSLLFCFLLIHVTVPSFFFFVTVDVDDLHSLFVVQINQSEYQDNVTVRFSDILYLMQYCVKLVKLAAYVNFFCKFSFKLIQPSISLILYQVNFVLIPSTMTVLREEYEQMSD